MYSDLGVLETMGAAFEARKTAWVASVDAREALEDGTWKEGTRGGGCWRCDKPGKGRGEQPEPA
jgi:hypothetical protein